MIKAKHTLNFYLKFNFQNKILKNRFYATKSKYVEKDLVVIGGGSGGLACAKEAADLGMKVAVLDLVTPSPRGTKWGLGGTCVNVGCIPKKLMHQAAILGHSIKESEKYGWKTSTPTHDWETLASGVQSYVRSLNWGHRVQLNEKEIEYFNGRGSFIDANTVKSVNIRGKETLIRSKHFVISVGGRPSLPNIPGAKELCITSDDLFWKTNSPGKTLVIGGSYVGLECAGFLTGLNLHCDVMIRSVPLRGFDQQISEMLVDEMAEQGTNFMRNTSPLRFDRSDSGRISVKYESRDGVNEQLYDTVLLATGRRADTELLGLENAGVNYDVTDGKIPVNENEQTNVDNIYAIGDVAKDRLELTPVAAMTGRTVARRLDGQLVQMDHLMVPTTVFTPMEYSCVGHCEEDALKIFGENNIEVFHAYYRPLEFNVCDKSSSNCYIKLICMRDFPRKIIGLHFVGPNAGEVMQGFACAIKIGLTYDQLVSTMGIHPTCAEEIVRLNITKRSGKDPKVTGC